MFYRTLALYLYVLALFTLHTAGIYQDRLSAIPIMVKSRVVNFYRIDVSGTEVRNFKAPVFQEIKLYSQ
jgi:hypothetical protein